MARRQPPPTMFGPTGPTGPTGVMQRKDGAPASASASAPASMPFLPPPTPFGPAGAVQRKPLPAPTGSTQAPPPTAFAKAETAQGKSCPPPPTKFHAAFAQPKPATQDFPKHRPVVLNDRRGASVAPEAFRSRAPGHPSLGAAQAKAATTGGHAQPVGHRAGSVVQMRTAVVFNEIYDRPGTDTIARIDHDRGMHGATQTTLAAYLSGYDSVADAQADYCGICNHYVSYKMIADEVKRNVRAQGNLENVVNWLNGLALPGARTFFPADFNVAGTWSFQVGQIPAVNIGVASTNAHGTNFYVEAQVNREIDDLIANLANDPRNLFYWPDSRGDAGGTRTDWPIGEADGSEFTRVAVRDRLNDYRALLRGLGLNV